MYRFVKTSRLGLFFSLILAAVFTACSSSDIKNPVSDVGDSTPVAEFQVSTHTNGDDLTSGALVLSDPVTDFPLDGGAVSLNPLKIQGSFCVRGSQAANVGSFFDPHFVFVFKGVLNKVVFNPDGKTLKTPVTISSDNGKVYWANPPEFYKFNQQGDLGLFVHKSKIGFPWSNPNILARKTTLCILN